MHTYSHKSLDKNIMETLENPSLYSSQLTAMPMPLLFLQHKNEEHQHISNVTLYDSIRKHVFCLSAEITNRTKKNHNIIAIKIVTKKS